MTRSDAQLEARVALLEQTVEKQRALIETLEAALAGASPIPPVFALTGAEAAVLACLYTRKGLATKEQIHAALYSARSDDPPELKIVDVYVCKLRKKLRRWDITIETVWAQGYRLPPESRERLGAIITEAAT